MKESFKRAISLITLASMLATSSVTLAAEETEEISENSFVETSASEELQQEEIFVDDIEQTEEQQEILDDNTEIDSQKEDLEDIVIEEAGTVEIKNGKLFKDNPIVTVNDKLVLNYYDGVKVTPKMILDTVIKSSTPEFTTDNTTVEYLAGYSVLDIEKLFEVDFQPLDFEIPNDEWYTRHKFGEQSKEKVRITFKGDDTYKKYQEKFEIELKDLRAPTHIAYKDAVPEIEIGSDYEKILKPYIYVADGDDKEISGAQVSLSGIENITQPGKFDITIKYSGKGGDYAACEDTVKITIKDAPHFNVSVNKKGEGKVDAPTKVKVTENVSEGFTVTASPIANSGYYTESITVKKNDNQVVASNTNSNTLSVGEDLFDDGDSAVVYVIFSKATITLQSGEIDDNVKPADLKAAIFKSVYKESKPNTLTKDDVVIEFDAGFDGFQPLDFTPRLGILSHAFAENETETVKVSYIYNGETISDTTTIKITDHHIEPLPVFKTSPVLSYYKGKTVSENDILEAVVDAESKDANINLLDMKKDGKISISYKANTLEIGVWKSIDFTPNVIGDIGLHAFGEKEYEQISISFSGDDVYKTKKWEIELQLMDLRTPTKMTFNPQKITSVYGEDLKEKILPAVTIFTDDKDTLPVKFDKNSITIEPTELNAAPLTPQEVTVKYAGDEQHKNCEAVIPVYVQKATARISVKGGFVSYGDKYSLTVTSKPENLDYLVTIAGIDNNLKGFVSIYLPESIRDKMVVKEPITGKVIFNLYDYLDEKIGDGLTSKELLAVISGVRDILNKNIPGSDKKFAELLDFDIDSLNKVVELLEGLEQFDDKTEIKLAGLPTQAGVYWVAAVSTDPNYNVAADVGNITILPKNRKLELRWNKTSDTSKNLVLSYEEAKTFDFGGAIYESGVKLDKQESVRTYFGGTKIDILPELGNEPIREPGTYVEALYVLGGNFWAEPLYRTYTIKPVDASIEIDEKSLTVDYDGKRHAVTAKAKAADGTDLTDKLIYTYVGDLSKGTIYLSSNIAPDDAGTYIVNVLYPGDKIHDSVSKTVTLTINKMKPTIKLEDKTVTYSGRYQYIDPAVVTLPDGKKYSGDINYLYYKDKDCKKLLSTLPVNAGTYYVKASTSLWFNYEIATSDVKTLTIEKATPVITVDDLTVVYDGKIHKNEVHTKLVNNEKPVSYLMEYTFSYYTDELCQTQALESAPKNAGTYYVKVSVGETANYTSAVNSTPAKLVITPADIKAFTLNLKNKTYMYSGSAIKPIYFVNHSTYKFALVEDKDYTVEYYIGENKVDAADVKNAAEYKICVTGKNNYSGSLDDTFSILPKVEIIDTIGYTKQAGEVIDSITADKDGKYTITEEMISDWELNDGTYQIQIEFGDRTDVDKLVINSSKAEEESKDIVKGNIYTSVDNTEGTIPVIASNLSNAANNIVDNESVNLTEQKVDISLKVTDASNEQKQDAKTRLKISDDTSAEFYDMSVFMTLSDLETGTPAVVNQPIADTISVLEVIVPLTMKVTSGKLLKVSRLHKNNEEILQTSFKQIKSREQIADGTYMISGDRLILFTRYFSVYAVCLEDEPVPSTGGGGGGGASFYKISTPTKIENGNLSVNKDYATPKNIITVTTNPDDGYRLDSLTVTSATGKNIELTDNGDGIYTFMMPNARVDVDVSYVKDDDCKKDETCPIDEFLDSDPEQWYHDGVHYCLENGIMVGVDDAIFAPNRFTTRAMVVTTLWRMNGCPIANYFMSFADVPYDAWYAEAVRWAQSVGVVTGYSEFEFGPDDIVTREQMAAILYRYAKFNGIDTDLAAEDAKNAEFNDLEDVSEWATDAMDYCIFSGLISGLGNNAIAPKKNATRAEFATILSIVDKMIK